MPFCWRMVRRRKLPLYYFYSILSIWLESVIWWQCPERMPVSDGNNHHLLLFNNFFRCAMCPGWPHLLFHQSIYSCATDGNYWWNMNYRWLKSNLVSMYARTHTHTHKTIKCIVYSTHFQTSIYVGWNTLRFVFHFLQYDIVWWQYIHFIYRTLDTRKRKFSTLSFQFSKKKLMWLRFSMSPHFTIPIEKISIFFCLSVWWTVNRIQQFNWSKISDSKAGTNDSCDVRFMLPVPA